MKGMLSQMEMAAIAHVKVITANTDASAVFFNEWRHLSEPYLSDFLKLRDDYEGRFISIIENGIAAGEFQQVDSKFMMLAIISSLNWTHNWYKPGGKLKPEEVAKKLSNLILNGLKNRLCTEEDKFSKQ